MEKAEGIMYNDLNSAAFSFFANLNGKAAVQLD